MFKNWVTKGFSIIFWSIMALINGYYFSELTNTPMYMSAFFMIFSFYLVWNSLNRITEKEFMERSKAFSDLVNRAKNELKKTDDD